MQLEPEWWATYFDHCGFISIARGTPSNLRIMFYNGSDEVPFHIEYRVPLMKEILNAALEHTKKPEKVSWIKAALAFLDNEERYPDPTALLVNKQLQTAFEGIHEELEEKWRKQRTT
jgi:hypothetical protein